MTTAPIADPETTAKIKTGSVAILEYVKLALQPCSILWYKPNKKLTGTALRIDVRLAPKYNDKGYIEAATKDDGGVFAVIAKQKDALDDNGNANFDWDGGMTVKLGRPDLSNILFAIQSRRFRKGTIPGGKVDKDGNNSVEMIHKFAKSTGPATTTIIGYKLLDDGAFFTVSKSATERSAVKLSLVEELELELYLTNALNAAHAVGKR